MGELDKGKDTLVRVTPTGKTSSVQVPHNLELQEESMVMLLEMTNIMRGLIRSEVPDIVREEVSKAVAEAVPKAVAEAVPKAVKSEIVSVNKRLDGIDDRLDGIDDRLDGIDDRLDGVDNRLDGVDKTVQSLTSEVRQGFKGLAEIFRLVYGINKDRVTKAHNKTFLNLYNLGSSNGAKEEMQDLINSAQEKIERISDDNLEAREKELFKLINKMEEYNSEK